MCTRWGEGSHQRIQVGGGGERSVWGESCTQDCTRGDPWPTQETTGVNPAANFSLTPSGSPGAAGSVRAEMQPDPGEAGRGPGAGRCRWAGRGRVRRPDYKVLAAPAAMLLSGA